MVVGNDSIDEKETLRNNKLDNAFKEVMSLADILSHTLGPLITELNDLEPEVIKSYLPLEKEGDRIIKLEQELPTPDGSGIRLDVLFELRIPGNQPINVEVNLEGQAKRRLGYPMGNRALYYTSTMIHDQKGKYFKGEHYEKMNKVYSIWLMLSPRKDSMNSIVRHHMVADTIYGNNTSNDSNCNLMEIIEVNIGDRFDFKDGMLGLLNILFTRNIDASERIRLLGEYYNIEKSEYLIKGVTKLSMIIDDTTLDEEIMCDRM